ncbi:fatty acid-binding protein 1, liver-like [Anthonomus grandis grandis]|uniref:fatty acid-binding protein 1, liver-like n=1 Tax=Anthonomus grandis grandis TaxID=2921223 RepID=UPI002166A64F|nr:fatty acid-binding protein 1, liver-like [Anthonomus grandis grandis]
MALTGKYELIREEGQLEFLTAVGVPEERAKKMLADKTLEITLSGNSVSLTRPGGQKQTLTFGEEKVETGPDGRTIKNIAKLDGDKLLLDSQFGETGSLKREYVLSGNELTVISTSEKPGVAPGKRIYKKI